ncbi:MAG: M36 family metallopeptidase, partial [Chitinophagaceae bacterium]|nr:M36 family metallopeptidase [Chitinophagaceae bacterium]
KTFQKQSVQQPAQFGETDVTTATYRVIPYPAESPIHPGGSPALQKDPWLLAGATNPATTLQWHYNGVQYFDSTRGNNVLVQEDVNANNGLGKGANSSTIQPSLLFDVAPDFTTQPTAPTNQAFAITNLFYWCNILHDLSYQYGFDEQSGNFQENNLNRGGSGNDYLLADAQDGSGFNNANFTTPPDGINPRMQVFLFGGSTQKDGDLDNGIICHEYAHGITTRLTGGPSNSGCLQNAERLGEGWSDYFALMFTTNWATTLPSDGSKSRTLANYSLSQQVSGPGWRKYPYSTDMSVNPHTYADLPGTAGLIHNIGEVWASVLWDMTWEIIKLAGINPNLYDANGVGGNSVSLKLVMTGLKLQPCSPGFIDGRNAILRADTLLYNGLYSCAIWKAFAKRGMGVFAQQGRSDNYQDQVPDFTTYSFPYLTNHVDKAAASQEENITYTIKVDAPHCQSIAGFKLTDTLPAILNFISATEGTYEPAFNSVTIPNINLSAGQSKSFSITAKIKSNIYHPPVIYIEDHVDGRINAIWNTTSTSTNVWQNSSATYHSPGHSYFAKNENSQAVAILKTAGNYLLDGKGILSFWHNYNLEEGYDGAVIEISTNDGNTWQDLNPYIIKNGYNGFVDIHTTFIGGKQAYTGNSGGFIETIADLSAFTNKNILIRFVAISDESGANDGWYVDDIVLESKTAIFNSARLFDNFGNVAKRADTITLINSNTLPITLFQFYGFRLKQSNQLIWISNNDQQNLGFEIQRSDDGLSFEPLGFVQSKPSVGFGSLQVSYNYIDSFNFKQIAYYRLKLIDKDRSFAFSKIIALKNARDDAEKSITIYPNPVISVLQVSLTASQNAEYVTSIIDNTGREFWKTSRQVKVGKNLFSINVSTLTKGVCLLKINSNMSHSLKVIKFLKQ